MSGVAVEATVALIIYSRIGWMQNNEQRLNKKKDLRMQYTTEAMTNAKLLKLYSWESTFESKIADVYKEEMSY